MKKVLIPFLLIIAASVSGQTTKPTTTKLTTTKPTTKPTTTKPTTTSPAVLKNQVDSLSYAIGVLDGTFFKTQGVTNVNGQLLGKGFTDVINGKPVCSPEVANEIVRREMQRMSQAKIQPNIDAGVKFLAENRKKPGIIETPSGLQYEIIKMGTGAKPTDSSVVKVHYDGTLINGAKFDSSRDKGEPLTISLMEVIRGWSEGLQLMPIGSRFKFYIPYTLGWGVQGSGENLPGGSVTLFDVELLDIVK